MASQALRRPIYVYWQASPIGGANVEAWATVRLWRSLGLAVSLFPRPSLPSQEWIDRAHGIGCEIVADRPPPGSIVVAWCNSTFRFDSLALNAAGCKLIYVPCMCWPWPGERQLPFDRYVFQSNYQRNILAQRLALPADRERLIRGAFDPAEFPFRPLQHKPGEPFVIGRLSRAYGQPGNVPARDKYPADLWQQYAAIPYRPLKARVMGWSPAIEKHCGTPPEWAECLPECAETAQEFLSTIHCLVPGIGCCAENWPRIGLEAMAAGVPIVAENKGGWREMLDWHWLADSVEQQSQRVAALANDPQNRFEEALAGQHRMEFWTDPKPIGEAWLSLFKELQASTD